MSLSGYGAAEEVGLVAGHVNTGHLQKTSRYMQFTDSIV